MTVHISFLAIRLQYDVHTVQYDRDRGVRSTFRIKMKCLKFDFYRASIYDTHVLRYAIAIYRLLGFFVDGVRLGNIC